MGASSTASPAAAPWQPPRAPWNRHPRGGRRPPWCPRQRRVRDEGVERAPNGPVSGENPHRQGVVALRATGGLQQPPCGGTRHLDMRSRPDDPALGACPLQVILGAAVRHGAPNHTRRPEGKGDARKTCTATARRLTRPRIYTAMCPLKPCRMPGQGGKRYVMTMVCLPSVVVPENHGEGHGIFYRVY